MKPNSRQKCKCMGLAMILLWAILLSGCCKSPQGSQVALNTPGPKSIEGEVNLVHETSVLQYNIIDHKEITQ